MFDYLQHYGSIWHYSSVYGFLSRWHVYYMGTEKTRVRVRVIGLGLGLGL